MGPRYTQADPAPPVVITYCALKAFATASLTNPCGQSRIRTCWESRESTGEFAMAEAAPDDVFSDDITFPAADGYLLGATLFLPRVGTRHHAVLINSATAVPRKIYRGFAAYLARRGCAVLTYDYRGIGDSRQRAVSGYNPPQSHGCADATRTCRSAMLAIPSAARRWDCFPTTPRFPVRC